MLGQIEPNFEEKIKESSFQWNITVNQVKKEAMKRH